MGKIIQPGDGDPRHGTANGYNNLHCGKQPDGSRRACTPCRNAAAERHYQYMNEPGTDRLKRHAERMRAHRQKVWGKGE